MRLQIRYRGPRYADRTLALETREVRPVGIDLEYKPSRSIAGLFEAVRDGAADVAEVLLADMVTAIAGGEDRVLALPVFPSRRFPHRGMYVRHDSVLDDPARLDAARVGWPSMAATGAVWARAMAANHGAEPVFVQGTIGGSLARLDRGSSSVEPTLVTRIINGDLDVLVTPYPVSTADGGAQLRRLIRAPGEQERAYVRAGHGFPMTTVIAIRRAVYERNRWAACSLVDAFAEAQAVGRARMNYYGAIAVSLPFLSRAMEEIDELFGGEAYPYGVPANEELLSEFALHAHALGVAQRVVATADLFAVEVLEHPGVPDLTRYNVPLVGTH